MTNEQYNYIDKCLTHGLFVDIENKDGSWYTLIPIKDLASNWRYSSYHPTQKSSREHAGMNTGRDEEFWLKKDIKQIIPYHVGEPYKVGDEVILNGLPDTIETVSIDGFYKLVSGFSKGHTSLLPAPPKEEEMIETLGEKYSKKEVTVTCTECGHTDKLKIMMHAK